MRGGPGSCLLCHWQTGGPSLHVRTMGCWRIVCKGHGRAGRGPALSSGTGDQGWVQEPHRRGKVGPGRDLPAGGRGGARVQPGQAHGRNDNPPPLVGRPAWTARPGVGGGVRLPVRRSRRSAQPRRGQVVCDPVLLDRRAAKLGSITVRFNDNFRRLDLVLESKKLQWQHFPGLPEPAAAFLRVRKETGDQRPVFRGMTADFQVG